MKQKRIFQMLGMAIISSFLLAPVYAMAPKKLNFSGGWILNESKSELGEGRARYSTELTVRQENNSMMVERISLGRDGETRTTSQTLTMDGQENVNEANSNKSTTTVTWSDDAKSLNLKSDIVMTRQGETMNIKSTEIWTMSEDGKILTIQSASTSSRGDRSMKLVYDKK